MITKKKSAIILICILWICFACSKTAKINEPGTIPSIHIDVSELSANETSRLSELFEPLAAIALETKPTSIIQKIDKLVFHNDDIYVLDSEGAKGLLVFSKDGKFKHRIGNQGNGPGEYPEAFDFDISNQEIRILSFQKLHYYTTSGEYLRHERLGFTAQYLTEITADYDAYYGSAKEDRVIVADKKGHKKYSFFKYSDKNSITPPSGLQKLDTSVLVNIPFCDTIFNVFPNHITPHCLVNFGAASFTNHDYERLANGNEFDVPDYLFESKQYAYKMNFFEIQNYRFLSFVYRKQVFGYIESIASAKKRFYNLFTCEDDIWFSRTFTIPKSIIEGDRLVFVQNFPSEIIAGQKYLKSKLKNKKISKVEKEHLEILDKLCETLDELSNPVLFIAKIREDQFNK